MTEFPAFYNGRRDLKGAYFANAPLRMVDALVLADPQRERFFNLNTTRPQSIRVRNGSSILISIHFYNAAFDPAASDTTIIANARITAGVPVTDGTPHSISAGVVGDNTKAVYSTMEGRGGDVAVRSDEPVRLVYVPGSTFACVHRPPVYERRLPTATDPTGICDAEGLDGRGELVHLPDGIVNGAVALGFVPGQLSGFVVFRLDAVAAARTAL